jgi:hypothetical protein
MPQQFWDKFWFTAADPKPLGFVRIGWSLLTIAYLATWFVDVTTWIGSDGILATPRIAELLQSAADEQPIYLRISPLYWMQSETLLYAYLSLGIALAVIAATGLFGRISSLCMWLFVISIVHRAPMLGGLCEPILTMGWGYLTIHSGKEQKPFRLGLSDSTPSLAANIALHLMQIHLYAWIMLSLASQLGGLVWWQGEAVWWLASESRSPALSLSWLGRNVYALNALTHGVIIAQCLALFMLWPKAVRKYGVCALWATCGLLILVSDQLLYPLLLAILGIVFWDVAWVSDPRSNINESRS